MGTYEDGPNPTLTIVGRDSSLSEKKFPNLLQRVTIKPPRVNDADAEWTPGNVNGR
jgi:hypothetical protein